MSEIYGSTMLAGAGSQYLHPDYVHPLPTTLDAKKSPLALLAQTCSSIGKDSNVPPSKSIIPPIEKKDGGGKTSPDKPVETGHKRPVSAERKDAEVSDSTKQRERRQQQSPKISGGSSKSANSSDDEETAEDKRHSNSASLLRSLTVSPRNDKTADKLSSHTSSAHSGGNVNGLDMSQESRSCKPTKSPILSTPSTLSSVSSSKPGSSSHPLLPSVSFGASLLPGYPLLSAHGIHMDPSLASAYSSLGAHANGLAFPSPLSAASALKSTMPPYVSYSRIRTSTGSTLIPICRDPYCVNCQMSLQNSHLSATCTASGCSQCAHEKSLLASLYSPTAVLPPTLPHGFPGLNGLAGSTSLANSALLNASMYPYNMFSSPAAHPLTPFVCNWVSGSDYCGKRFNNSDDLLQHLRTHTSISDASSLAAHFPFGLVTPSASALAALHAHYASPGLLSPADMSVRRSYPLSLSPVSSSVAAGRFHPYKPTLPPLPPSSALANHPTLAPYYSPYSLYAQRVGAGAP